MADYTDVYSQGNQQNLVNQYAQSLAPSYAQAQKKLRASLAGTGGLSGSPLQYGLGDVAQQNLGQIGQYASQLGTAGAAAQENARLQNQNLAQNQNQFNVSQFGNTAGTGTNFAQQGITNQASQFGQNLAQNQNQFNVGQFGNAAGTGTAYNQQTLNQSKDQQDYNKLINEANMTGKWNGQDTLQGMLTNQQLAPDTSEATAQKLGFANANEAAQYANFYPDEYKKMVARLSNSNG